MRVGADYYLATSTFEWWPGVRLFHSRNLVDWELKGGILNETRLADLRGVPDSGGIWAPALSWCEGLFHLVYTDVKNFRHPYKDLVNWLITADSVEGPWSDPVYLNRSGFDPSLFHDDDGKSWLLNMVWTSHPERHPFAGIAMQEYDRRKGCLLGAPSLIFKGSRLGRTEGPHLFKRQGWYYLITAEGGTGWEHAVTICRSRKIGGPYELSPHHPMLSSRDQPDHPLQKAGHASMVETPDGEWYMAHLCARPVGSHRRCILGRETALQHVVWTAEGWPVLAHGGNLPSLTCPVRISSRAGQIPAKPPQDFQETFPGPSLSPRWNTLREPFGPEWLNFLPGGGIRMAGRSSLGSTFDQSLIGLRVESLSMDCEVLMEFDPSDFHQGAGLGLYYNTACHYFLAMGHEEGWGAVLRILVCNAREVSYLPSDPVRVTPGRVWLKAELRCDKLNFYYQSGENRDWMSIGPTLDATILSDDYPLEKGLDFAFTGTFAVLAVQDALGLNRPADFLSFSARSFDPETYSVG